MSSAGEQRLIRSRVPILYLGPWVDFGGSDKGTIDWFKWLDRGRFAASLITTQPSANRRLHEIYPYAEEVWALPEHFSGKEFPHFIFDFIHTRGVRLLHIMNSRLAFDLLPDLAALENPPAVVVQLHVEEADRSGYVRYVTTRYGNLVDAFVATSEYLARSMADYDVPAGKIHVLPTGVDAQTEFNPSKVDPADLARGAGMFHILCPGRLVEQKDPLLMVEVLAGVMAAHERVHATVIGDGPMDDAVRERAAQLGLRDRISFQPPASELARWLRASDVMLMTSVFEGVPYVAYEAMAMGVPVVAPALPGNVELMSAGGGVLIEQRDDVEAYVGAICRLIEDDVVRADLGTRGRARMLAEYSPAGLAARQERIYEDLLELGAPWSEDQATADAGSLSSDRPEHEPLSPRPAAPGFIPLQDRPVSGAPLVSIVSPCFNHGRYLKAFMHGIETQAYPQLEVIMVDDASTDPMTIDALAELEADDRVRVIRQAHNAGPSAARNRAIDAARGRYILPVDVDNVLLPGAVSSLVEQLQRSPERVGFIYPSFRYFGTRDYQFDAPPYNLFELLCGNFVDTCSLLDRGIFDAGLRYAEEIELGHEDWDLALSLAARQVYGEPSRAPVMLYRKQGFTRSDLVEYRRVAFWSEIQDRHPELFGEPADLGEFGRYRGPAIRIKARWNPALSIVSLVPLDFDDAPGRRLIEGLRSQSCQDFELVSESPKRSWAEDLTIRRIPPGLTESPVALAQECLDAAAGTHVVLTAAPNEMFGDPTMVEKLLRGFWRDPELHAIAFIGRGDQPGFPHRVLADQCTPQPAHAVALRRDLPHAVDTVRIAPGVLTESLARALHSHRLGMQWRHLPTTRCPAATGDERSSFLVLRRPEADNAGRAADGLMGRRRQPPALPAMAAGQVPRWGLSPAWMPPETLPLVRHFHPETGQRTVTNDRTPPPGYRIEFDLGSIQRFAPPGTRRLVASGGEYTTRERGSERRETDDELGHLEEVPLPLFVGIERAVLGDGSQTLVVADPRDPIRGGAQELSFLGFIESFPNEPLHGPRRSPGRGSPVGPALIRFLDLRARRHRYGVALSAAELPSGLAVSAELGRLAGDVAEPTWELSMDSLGRLHTVDYMPPPAAPGLVRLARWTLAPATWRGLGYRVARARAIARRTAEAARQVPGRPASLKTAAENKGTPLGRLYRNPGPGRIELFAAAHPVLGDQLLTHHPIEATDLGYEDVRHLGYVQAQAPVTGKIGGRRTAIPWASHFGLRARPG